jgi:hypothetical protein
MQALYTAVLIGDKGTIVKVITEAKQTAAELLEGERYHEFCHYLLEGHRLVKDRN